MKFHISKHAREESERRGITPEIFEAVLENPDQIVEEYEGKKLISRRLTQEVVNIYSAGNREGI
jgi:hypothetical protein